MLLLSLVLGACLLLSVVAQAPAPSNMSCSNIVSGDFSGSITDSDECESACAVAGATGLSSSQGLGGDDDAWLATLSCECFDLPESQAPINCYD
jgi:hypothetical protein